MSFRDKISGAGVVIDTDHNRIHDGHYYGVSFVDLVFAASAVFDMRISTGADTPHMKFGPACSASFRTQLYEAASLSVGSALTIFNRNRNSDRVSKMAAITTAPTVGGVGTLIYDTINSAGPKNGVAVSGGPYSSPDSIMNAQQERILKPNTEYLLRVTNVRTAEELLAVSLAWYEDD